MTTTPGEKRPISTSTKTKTVIQDNTATNTAHTQLHKLQTEQLYH